ncbi:MAG: glycoside hydrolase family 28 protein, partial [Bacteroidetes bacterium]|nr:glycoside hydrolase family 28 protein [Bacteroidota bacterium]
VGDGKQINTGAIQRAIDSCAEKGGRVLIPKGTFLSGTLYLRSTVTLDIAEGATLKGSPYFKDYPVNEVQYKNAFTHKPDGRLLASRAFLFAENVHHIVLTGKGTIDGSGDAADFNLGNDSDDPKSRLRPCMLLFIHCTDIKVYDLRLANSAYWLQNYIGCDSLHLRGLMIYNHTNYNQDGIDIDARHVLVENCKIDVDDDGICFKSHERKNIVENVVVRGCTIASNCNAIKFGTVSMGGFRNVYISHCSIEKASADHIRHWQQNLRFIQQPVTVLSGIALESVDGAVIDSVKIEDITMKDVQTPVFIVLGNKGRLPVGDTAYRKGQIRNIYLHNIIAKSHSKMASSVTGYPGAYVENIRFDNIVINGMGMGTMAEANAAFPENEKGYPENRMYGLVYPASGFYLRHVKNISFNKLGLSVRSADARPALMLEDVKGARITDLQVQSPPLNGMPAVRLVKSSGITLTRAVVAGRRYKIP